MSRTRLSTRYSHGDVLDYKGQLVSFEEYTQGRSRGIILDAIGHHVEIDCRDLVTLPEIWGAEYLAEGSPSHDCPDTVILPQGNYCGVCGATA